MATVHRKLIRYPTTMLARGIKEPSKWNSATPMIARIR